MKDLHQMSYEEFGKLRFLAFFKKTDDYFHDTIGCMELPDLAGLSCSEGNGAGSYFASPLDSNQTVSISLDFEEGCSETEGNALLQRMGLLIYKGMAYEQVKKILGQPTRDTFGTPTGGNSTELRYVFGAVSQFYVDCFITEREGLSRVRICRKDLADESDAW